MPGILEPKVEEYLGALVPKRDALLSEMERYAAKHAVPIIGPACGRLLYALTQISKARRIFEMGSAIGYSTIWFARAAGPRVQIFYTDGNPANAARAKKYFERAGVAGRIRILTGNALDLIEDVTGSFDIILIDIDKDQYPEALKKSLPRLARGGLLVADNVLWSGRVARSASDIETTSIKKFNRMIYGCKDLYPVIVPLRDGVAVCRKV